MNHFLQIQTFLNNYKSALKQINVESDKEFLDAVNAARKCMLDDFCKLRDEHPERLLCNYSKSMSVKDANQIVEVIRKNAKQQYDVTSIPCANYALGSIQHENVIIPLCINSLDGYSEISVGNVYPVKDEITQFLLMLMVSLPIKKIKYTFVDFGGSFLSDLFLKEINPSLYNNKPITDTYQFKEYLKQCQTRVINRIQQYGDIRKFNKKNKTIVEPYEIIVLFDNADKGNGKYIQDYETELSALKRNCAAGGVYIIDFYKKKQSKTKIEKIDLIITSTKDKSQLAKYIYDNLGPDITESEKIANSLPYKLLENLHYEDILPYKEELEEIGTSVSLQVKGKVIKNIPYKLPNSLSKSLINPSFIEEIPNLRKALLDYINTEAAKEEEVQVVSADVNELRATSFDPIIETIHIPVGKRGQEEAIFRMDLVSHVHAFILGQSGSGKSVFLHNVISGAMLKYSPEELELYLLDFKLGGVEFNRYKGEKHVHAMLVDNSDPQITLEILRELRDRMTERGKILRKASLTNIKEYNEQHPDSKMKHILFVADECHEMFRVDDNNRAISNEISNIIVKIAKEGRSQGIHLLLATQTLANTDISSEILNNVSDHYLLKCSIADSEKMVTNSSDITSKLATGNVYYHHVDNNYIFQAYFADKKQSEEIIQVINKKTAKRNTNEKFYFNGASIFRFESSSAIQGSARKCKKVPVAFAGKSIDIDQKDVAITLNEDYSENILLLGLNDEYQSSRVSMNLLISLLATCKYRDADVDFKVIDCLSDEDKYREVLDELEDTGLIEIVPSKKRTALFKQLADDIISDHAKETILFILGQDRFRELKLDLELEAQEEANNDTELTSIISFGSESADKKKSVKSFSEAMNVILDKGPETGVHTIIQLEKTANYLFTDYISHKELFQKFKHLVLLKSDENAALQLHLRSDIHLENLSKEEERMRAYYYAEESDSYTLFTPYMPMEGDELKQFIKKLQ